MKYIKEIFVFVLFLGIIPSLNAAYEYVPFVLKLEQVQINPEIYSELVKILSPEQVNAFNSGNINTKYKILYQKLGGFAANLSKEQQNEEIDNLVPEFAQMAENLKSTGLLSSAQKENLDTALN
ncbi:MAG: hypothetical protein P4L22_01540, partial [Candidatus Babeliales bacterium]|nr:hypothetical protein [Candidatus Babeliales bacterium]